MLNVESGKKLFDNGKYIDTPNHEDYNTFTGPGVIQTIKPIEGHIYCTVDDRLLVQLSDKLLEFEEEQYDILVKYKHLCGFMPFFSNSDSLTIAKAKIDPEKSTTITIKPKRSHKRAIFDNSTRPKNKTAYKNHVFTWFVKSVPYLVNSILPSDYYYDKRKREAEFKREQIANILFSVCFDENDEFNFKDNERIVEYINARNLRAFNNLFPLTFYGIDKSNNCNTFGFLFQHEALTPVLIYNPEIKGDLSLCFVYRCANSYYYYRFDNMFYSLLENQKEISNIPFNETEIDNSIYQLRTANKYVSKNDECAYCGIPLYGQIFLILPDKAKKKCCAFCKICAHVCFSNRWGKLKELKKTDVFAYTQYPRTPREVLTILFNKIKLKDQNSKKKKEINLTDQDINSIIDVIESMYKEQPKQLNDYTYLITTATQQYLAFTEGHKILGKELRELELKYPKAKSLFMRYKTFSFVGDFSYLTD
jgi:hypothetical protein